MPKEEGHGAHYYGGQAVIEGVMMRGSDIWAVAVRRPSGAIYLERHPVSDFPRRHPAFRKPLLRGMFALVDALTIGTRALAISANESVEESEQLSGGALGGSLAVALLLFIGVFVALPNFGLAFAARWLGDGLLYHVVEGLVRIGIFLAYLAGISLMSDIRRVFAYHGAEHKTIAAWEHSEPLEPSVIDRYSTLHVRCGTNFLLMVMLIAIVVYSLAGVIVPAPDGGWLVTATYHIVLRVALLPVVAGLAYEGLRLGAGKDNALVSALMQPGLWLQRITTKPPTEDQIEVAIRAFEAVVPRAELNGSRDDLESEPGVRGPSPGLEPEVRGTGPGLESKLVWGADEADSDVYGRAGLADVTGERVEDG